MILILEYLVYQNIYIFYFILLNTRGAISTQTKLKSVLVEKKPSIFKLEFTCRDWEQGA